MVKPATSKTTPNVLNATCPPITAPNPYARDPSRRAIACVACAKAKTRCDKALPSCARCVTKGLTCDPRSTRRTSDNNYRTLPIKKAFVAPKRFPTPGVLPSSNAFPSPRSIPSSRPRAMMRAPSHIDFRTAVKMSQQAAIMSGVPKLTPLPTYQSQIVDECWDYTPSPEPELRFTPEMEQDGFPFSRGATPQTPSDPFGCHEPLPILDGMDYLDCQPWSNEGLVPVGLGFAGMDTAIATDTWMTPTTPEPEDMVQANMFAQSSDFPSATQMQGSFDGSLSTVREDWCGFQTSMPDELVTDVNANANANANAKAMEGSMDSGIVMQGEWLHGQSSHGYVDMSNMVTSAPYVPKMQGIPNNAPMWEDVFMPSSVVY